MTRRELNIAIFEGKGNNVLWQPRLETWIGYHMGKGTLPEKFKYMSALEIYDALGCSIRYGACSGIECFEIHDDMVKVEEEYSDKRVVKIKVPSGEIQTVYREIWEDGKLINRRIEEYPVKRIEDLKVVIDIINRQQFKSNIDEFLRAEKTVGHRAEPTIFLSSSGFTELIKNGVGL